MRKTKIIKGAFFDKLFVIQPKTSYYFEPSGKKNWNTLVRCRCEKEYEIKNAVLLNKNKKQCDECHYKDSISVKIGDNFDMLTVIGFTNKTKNNDHGRFLIICKCACGNKKTLRLDILKSRDKNHCGCMPPAHCVKVGKLYRCFFNEIKGAAKIRKIDFNLTIEQIWYLYEKQNGKCALSGIKIDFGKQAKLPNTASLDRIDSLKPYIIDNVQWLHKDVNKMKMNLDQDRFIHLCKLISYTIT